MNFKKALILGSLLLGCSSVYANDLTPKEFVDCYQKAVNESIQEIKADDPDAEMCDQMSANEQKLLNSLYVDEFIRDGEYIRFSSYDIMSASIQSHYDFISRNKLNYNVSCYESQFHLLKRTDLDLIEEALEKMFNVKLGWTGWSQDIKDLDTSYCK